MSTIEIEIPPVLGLFIYVSRKMRGTLLKVSATYCVGIVERSRDNELPRSQTPYLNVAYW